MLWQSTSLISLPPVRINVFSFTKKRQFLAITSFSVGKFIKWHHFHAERKKSRFYVWLNGCVFQVIADKQFLAYNENYIIIHFPGLRLRAWNCGNHRRGVCFFGTFPVYLLIFAIFFALTVEPFSKSQRVLFLFLYMRSRDPWDWVLTSIDRWSITACIILAFNRRYSYI